VLDDLGNPKGALEKYEASLEMKYAIHPEGRKAKTQSIAMTLSNQAFVMFKLGDLNGSHESYKLSLEIQYAIHPDGRNATSSFIIQTKKNLEIVSRRMRTA